MILPAGKYTLVVVCDPSEYNTSFPEFRNGAITIFQKGINKIKFGESSELKTMSRINFNKLEVNFDEKNEDIGKLGGSMS